MDYWTRWQTNGLTAVWKRTCGLINWPNGGWTDGFIEGWKEGWMDDILSLTTFRPLPSLLPLHSRHFSDQWNESPQLKWGWEGGGGDCFTHACRDLFHPAADLAAFPYIHTIRQRRLLLRSAASIQSKFENKIRIYLWKLNSITQGVWESNCSSSEMSKSSPIDWLLLNVIQRHPSKRYSLSFSTSFTKQPFLSHSLRNFYQIASCFNFFGFYNNKYFTEGAGIAQAV